MKAVGGARQRVSSKTPFVILSDSGGFFQVTFDGYFIRGANLAGAEICEHIIYPEPIGNYGLKYLWWLVLEEDTENNRILLLALDCATFREYHHEWVKTTWKECDLRGWLNGAFLKDAFRYDSRRILPITVHTNDNSSFKTSAG